jgi:hypothetical protein
MSRRDGIDFTDQLLCTPNDEAHKQYFVPLPNAEDEELAHCMADVSYSACAERFTNDITQEEADRVYDQYLADSRRMLCDGEYSTIFFDRAGRRAAVI